MDPQLSGFALGLLFAAAKVGAIGTIVCAIGWWRSHRKVQRLNATLPEPGRIEERLAGLEQAADFSAGRIEQLLQGQDAIARRLGAMPEPRPLPRPGDTTP